MKTNPSFLKDFVDNFFFLLKNNKINYLKPESKGFVAILNVGFKAVPKKLENFLSEAKYHEEIGI